MTKTVGPEAPRREPWPDPHTQASARPAELAVYRCGVCTTCQFWREGDICGQDPRLLRGAMEPGKLYRRLPGGAFMEIIE